MGAKKREQQNNGDVAGLKVLAAQTLKIASINGLGRLDKLENELEDEINYENRSPAKTAFGRFRREGEHKLHTKAVLFIIVILNIVDTLLVMIGLILDFHHTSLALSAKSKMLESFNEEIDIKYKFKKTDENEILQMLLNANIIFNTSAKEDDTALASDCVHYLNSTAAIKGQTVSVLMEELLNASAGGHAEHSFCFQGFESDNKTWHLSNNGEVESTLSTVAHKLHYCSVSILSLLVIILMLKLVCFGRRFFKERMLIFDGLVTIISFVLDIVFMNEVTYFTEEQIVIVLSLLFPWRVIRILNSLIAAVLDKQRLNLKILYTQKKKISRSLTETNSKVEVLQRHIEVLQALCSTRGIHDMEVTRALSGDGSGHKNGATGGLASMMALGKLAFQAADAFAPVSNGYKKMGSSGASPASTPFSSPKKTDNAEPKPFSENNNASITNQNGSSTTLEMDITESSLDSPTHGSVNPDSVTVHINGSGPLKDGESNGTTASNNQSEQASLAHGDEYNSRL